MSEIREAIEAAIASSNEPEQAVEQEVVETTETEPEVEAKSEPERDENGRFKKKEGAEEEAEPAQEATPEATEETEQVEPEPEPQVEQVKPPRALAAHLKAKWSELPDEVRKEFVRLENDSFKGVAALQEDARVGKALMNEITPYKPLIAAAGGTPETVVRNLLQTAAILRTGTPYEKQRAVMGIIQEYGIDLSNVQYQAPDPVLTRVQQLEQQLVQTKQQQEQQEESERINAVNSFLEEVDDKGNPKFPLDDNLAQSFYYEVLAVKETDPNAKYRDVLERAYENLSWKVPEIRQAKLAQQQAAAEAERKEKEAKSLQKKKDASVSIKGTPPSTTPASFEDLPLREQIKRQVYGGDKRI
jgi:hypothetical protein